MKLIEFMKFLGFSGDGIKEVVLVVSTSSFDMTDVALRMIAAKTGESYETVKHNFEIFNCGALELKP